jgi:integrase
MRASELRALDWAHIDLKVGLIRVRRGVGAWGTFGSPKSKAGKRDIPLPSTVIKMLREAPSLPQGLMKTSSISSSRPQPAVSWHMPSDQEAMSEIEARLLS